MGFAEDAIAAAESRRWVVAGIAKKAADAEQARIERNTPAAIMAPWFATIGVDPSEVNLAITMRKKEWYDPNLLSWDSSRYKDHIHQAETHLRFVIDGHEFRAVVFHAYDYFDERQVRIHRLDPRVDVSMRIHTDPIWEEFEPVNTKVEFGVALLRKEYFLQHGGPSGVANA